MHLRAPGAETAPAARRTGRRGASRGSPRTPVPRPPGGARAALCRRGPCRPSVGRCTRDGPVRGRPRGRHPWPSGRDDRRSTHRQTREVHRDRLRHRRYDRPTHRGAFQRCPQCAVMPVVGLRHLRHLAVVLRLLRCRIGRGGQGRNRRFCSTFRRLCADNALTWAFAAGQSRRCAHRRGGRIADHSAGFCDLGGAGRGGGPRSRLHSGGSGLIARECPILAGPQHTASFRSVVERRIERPCVGRGDALRPVEPPHDCCSQDRADRSCLDGFQWRTARLRCGDGGGGTGILAKRPNSLDSKGFRLEPFEVARA